MSKELSNLSLQELWELFPIFLVPHNSGWTAWFDEIREVLAGALAGCPIRRISHIGSTAVPGIWSKNIVDVLIEASPGADLLGIGERIEAAGFVCMSQGEGRLSFNMGYTTAGFAEKVFHVHLRGAGDNDELYFRDYLRAFPQAAKEYEQLKIQLWKKFEHDRDAYTDGKTRFIAERTSLAKNLYEGRY